MHCSADRWVAVGKPIDTTAGQGLARDRRRFGRLSRVAIGPVHRRDGQTRLGAPPACGFRPAQGIAGVWPRAQAQAIETLRVVLEAAPDPRYSVPVISFALCRSTPGVPAQTPQERRVEVQNKATFRIRCETDLQHLDSA